MKAMITILLVLGIVGVAGADDLGNQAPVKPVVTYPENIPNPERQGGDTTYNATVIPALPYSDSGTTFGYTNDYDAVCLYTGSTAPDVVYEYVATVTETRAIDLCGSAYDTKLYGMDAAQTVLACNDDFYSGAPCRPAISSARPVAGPRASPRSSTTTLTTGTAAAIRQVIHSSPFLTE